MIQPKAEKTLGISGSANAEPEARPFVQISDVTKVFSSRNQEIVALDGVSLNIKAGEFISVVGPSGCGKTTLLNLVAGLERATSGTLRIQDVDVVAPVTDVGIVFQDPTLMEWRTVLENVMLQIEVRKLQSEDYREHAVELLDNLGLSEFHDAYPAQLSGGMKQRVSIARALVHRPTLLLMDEPFSALDAITRDKLNLDLQNLCLRECTTTMFITHSITDAVFLGGRVVVMTARPGQIATTIEIGLPKPRSLAERETNEFAKYAGEIRTIFETAGVL